METAKHKLGDKDLEKIMGNLLRYGVLTSMVIVLIGGCFYLYQYGGQKPQYKEFLGEPRGMRQVSAVLQSALKGSGRSIIELGVFVLIATPIARIVFSVIGYILEKDYLYIIITLIVLFVIVINL